MTREAPHQETAQVVAVLEALVSADGEQLLTSELAARAGLSAEQADAVRLIAGEGAARGWVRLHGTEKVRRWSLGLALGLVAWAGRQALGGRAPGALVLTPEPGAPVVGGHRTAGAVFEGITLLCTMPTAVPTSTLAASMGLRRDAGRRCLHALASFGLASPVARADGERWRPGPRFFELAVRHTRYLRSHADLLNLHLQRTEF